MSQNQIQPNLDFDDNLIREQELLGIEPFEQENNKFDVSKGSEYNRKENKKEFANNHELVLTVVQMAQQLYGLTQSPLAIDFYEWASAVLRAGGQFPVPLLAQATKLISSLRKEITYWSIRAHTSTGIEKQMQLQGRCCSARIALHALRCVQCTARGKSFEKHLQWIIYHLAGSESDIPAKSHTSSLYQL